MGITAAVKCTTMFINNILDKFCERICKKKPGTPMNTKCVPLHPVVRLNSYRIELI